MMKAHILVAEQGGRGKFKIFSFSKISQSVCFGAGLGRNKQELPIFGYFVQFLGPVHSWPDGAPRHWHTQNQLMSGERYAMNIGWCECWKQQRKEQAAMVKRQSWRKPFPTRAFSVIATHNELFLVLAKQTNYCWQSWESKSGNRTK